MCKLQNKLNYLFKYMLQYIKKKKVLSFQLGSNFDERFLETHQLAANDVQLRCNALRDGACNILGFLLKENTKMVSETYAN